MRRLSSQLPVSVALVLLAVVSVFSWFAYREVRGVAMRSSSERIEDVSEQLAGLLMRSAAEVRAIMVRSASDSTLAAAFALRTPIGDAVRRQLGELSQSNAQVSVVELWDDQGVSVAQVQRSDSAPPPGPTTFPQWLAGDTVGISSFGTDGNRVWYDIAASVTTDGVILGYLVQRRVLTATSTSVQALSDLIGMESTILVGVPGGTWTDLSGVADGPADVTIGEAVEYEDGGWRIGAGTEIAGTPWVTWISSPRSVALARAEAFLRRIIPIAIGIVLAGGLGAWVVIRSLTAPLAHLTRAARSMASGTYEQPVTVAGPQELAELSASFNHMAERVQDTQENLERLVADRTAELRASEDQFRSVANTARDTIIMADARGSIVYFNPGAERTFQYRAEDVIGKPLTVLIPERFQEAHLRGFERHVSTGESQVLGRTIELIGRRKDGTEFPLELSLSSWNRNGGRVFAGIIRDVTARKAAEDELKRYAAQLETANAELEAFAYSVSHDLRTPLRAVHGYCHALAEDFGTELGPDGNRYIHRVSAGVERMGQLIDDLLELSRVTRAEMTSEVVHLDMIADEVVDELRRGVADRHVDVRIARGLAVTGDGRLLRLVMQNLLQNAWKFTEKRDRAVIEVGADEGRHTFYVRDNGAGFDMAYADKLFGAFERVHKASDFPGTGVGLAIVHRIIQRHGGRIWARAEEDRGATFYFTLTSP